MAATLQTQVGHLPEAREVARKRHMHRSRKYAPHSITSSARASSVAGTSRAESAALALALQLALELIEEAPVSSLREDLGRTRLDDARLAETQGPEPHRVLGFVLPPPEPDLLD